MAVTTTNANGEITIANDAIAHVAAIAALDCYGVVELVNGKSRDAYLDVFKKAPSIRGVRVVTKGDRIYLALQVIMKYGVSIEAVTESLKSLIRYSVEKFSGMIVEDIDIVVVGVKV